MASDVKGTIQGEEGEWGVETGRREVRKILILDNLSTTSWSIQSFILSSAGSVSSSSTASMRSFIYLFFWKSPTGSDVVEYCMWELKKKNLTRCKNGVMDEWKIVWVAGFQRDKSSSCFKWKFQVIFIFMHKNISFKSNNNTNPGFPAVSL